MQVGAGGFLVSTPTLIAENYSRYPSSFMRSGGGSGKIGFGSGIYCSYDDSICFHLHIQGNGELHYRYLNAGLITYDYVAYSTGNTTKTSDGTLKAASPVVKLFADGSFETNAESQGCTVTRMRIGEYLVEGCEGLNSDAAWGGIDGGFDIPTDRNKQPLIWLDYEVNADGSVLVKTYHRTHPAAPAFARNELQGISDGEPVDIPRDQFVSVRVEMPVDSLYNQKIRAPELVMTAGDGE